MTVAQILADKGHDIITVKETDTLHEVSKILGSNKIGAVLVMDETSSVCGILSERDIVRRLGEDGAETLKQQAGECCTKGVVSCSPGDTIDDVMRMMTKGRFRHMPVMQDGELKGMISIGDIVQRRISNAVQEAEDLKRYIHES